MRLIVLLIVLISGILVGAAYAKPEKIFTEGNEVSFVWQELESNCLIFSPEIYHPKTSEKLKITVPDWQREELNCASGFASGNLTPIYVYYGHEIFNLDVGFHFLEGKPNFNHKRFTSNYKPLSKDLFWGTNLTCSTNAKNLGEYSIYHGSVWKEDDAFLVLALTSHALLHLRRACENLSLDEEVIIRLAGHPERGPELLIHSYNSKTELELSFIHSPGWAKKVSRAWRRFFSIQN